MTATDLAADLKDTLRRLIVEEDGLVAEVLRALDVVIAAHRAECFGPSPVTEWLRGREFRRLEVTLVNECEGTPALTGKARAKLLDPIQPKIAPPLVGCGLGDNAEEATAAALNDCMVRQHDSAEHTEQEAK